LLKKRGTELTKGLVMKKIFATVALASTVIASTFCAMYGTNVSANEPVKAPAGAAAPTRAELLTRGQQIAGAVCVACHGLDGMSIVPANPNIAGMPPQYIAKQLEHFKTGTRKNAVMQGMSANLSTSDMAALGEYYFAQVPKVNAAARDKAVAERGQQIYRAGIADAKVPACAGCHGGAGAGIPSIYPRLAGQWPDYTYEQLQHYVSGARKHPMMSAVVSRMKESDLRAVAEYVAGMRTN
jgi:cytochrome c553